MSASGSLGAGGGRVLAGSRPRVSGGRLRCALEPRAQEAACPGLSPHGAGGQVQEARRARSGRRWPR